MSEINSLNEVISMLVTNADDHVTNITVSYFNTPCLSSLEVVQGIHIDMNQINCIAKFSDKVPNVKRKSPFNWRTVSEFCSKEDPSKTQRPGHSESRNVK